MNGSLFLMAIGLVVISAFMIATWMVSRFIENSGIIDVAWSAGFSIVTIIYLVLAAPVNSRQAVVASMMVLWSCRLTVHLLRRFLRWYPTEDVRYQKLKQDMGPGAEQKMILVFLWQGAILVLLSAPVAVSMADRGATFGALQAVGVAIWTVGVVGEWLADRQLARFGATSGNSGKTCDVGLWRYSRHPNYFFEWLVHVGLFVYVSDASGGAWCVIPNLVLLHLILNVTGVKPSEAHSLATRPDYVRYQQTTSPFVPWFRRTQL